MANTDKMIKIAALADMWRSANSLGMNELETFIHSQMMALAIERAVEPVLPVSPPPSPKPQRKAKHDVDQLAALHKNGRLNSDEPCYIMSNGYRENYIMRFENGAVRFFCPRDGALMTSPAQVSKHHSSQIYPGHTEPTKPGNGWKHIKLSERDNKTLHTYCSEH